jgi:uncharacterized membrane protein
VAQSVLATAVRRLEHIWFPEAVLAGMVATWAGTFIYLPKLRHDRFGTFGFDLGIYDQGTWLVSQLKSPFVTIRGLDLFGHHANIILLLLAPFYRLGAGPIFLLFVQVLSQASGAIAIYLLARNLLRSRWVAVALAGVLLLNPTYQWLPWEFFHPDALAIGPLLFAYWAARTGRWRWFVVAAALAVACKEDVALAMVVLGVIVFFRGNRRIGAVTAAASAGWFVIATRVLIPWRNGIGPFYDTFFESYLGDDPLEVPFRALAHPGKTYDLATAGDRQAWYWKMWAPWGFLPFLDLRAFAIGAPMIAVNVLTSFPAARDYRFHYASIVIVGSAVATVEAIGWLSRRRDVVSSAVARTVVVAGLVLVAALCSYAWGTAPYSRGYEKGTWPLLFDPRVRVKADAVREIPSRASVSAAYDIVPHLTHREKVYEFPVPWCNINWGVRGEHLDNPAGVDWLLIDVRLQNTHDSTLLRDLLAREFKVRSSVDGIVVAQRVRPPTVQARVSPPPGQCYSGYPQY